jgi:uncharacterized protein (TIGR02679 family)
LEQLSFKEVDVWWKDLQEDFNRLTQNHQDYLREFYGPDAEKHMRSEDFIAYKQNLIRYLQEFIQDLQSSSTQIGAQIEALHPEKIRQILMLVHQSELEVPRTQSKRPPHWEEDVRLRNEGVWQALTQWFTGESSTASQVMEVTNEVIRRVVQNAAILVQMQNMGVSNIVELRRILRLFAECETLDEAHKLSSQVFGVRQARHFVVNVDWEMERINRSAYEEPAMIYVLRPRVRTYKPRMDRSGFTDKSVEKETQRQTVLEEQRLLRRQVTSYIQNGVLDFEAISTPVPPNVRMVFLSWVALANLSPDKRGRTEYGQTFILKCYSGRTLRTRQEEYRKQMQSFAEIINQTASTVRSDICHRWLAALAEHRGGGYTLVRKEMAKRGVATALCSACKGVDWLETHAGQTIRLAVLSARATSNPHALDGNTTAGKLLLHLLAYRANRDFPKNAEQRDELYYQGGILCDSIASSVTQVGLVLNSNDNAGHPAFCAFRLQRENCTLTLTNLAKLFSACSPSGKVYLVENQMVFSQLCDHADRFHSPLICTSGQPQVAVLRLLDLLNDSKTDLFYSGDFDGKGLSIASRLMSRYQEHFHLWRMTPNDYAVCRSEEKLGDFCWKSISSDPDLEQTARALQTQGYAGYQELLLPVLLYDLTKMQ